MGWLRRHSGLVPYLLLAPGLLWLAIFYVYPAFQMFLASLSTRTGRDRLRVHRLVLELHGRAGHLLGPVHPVDRLRPGGDDRRVPHRLPARLCDRLPGGALQEPPAVPRHRPVLHELPAADAVVEDHPGRLRAPARAAQGDRHRARGLPSPRDAGGRRRRDHLQLPAVHDAAAVRRPREDRPPARRGGPGPVRRAVAAGRHDRRSDRGRLAWSRCSWRSSTGRSRSAPSAAHSSAPRSAPCSCRSRSCASCCRCRCRASSPGRCSRSSRPSATTSTPSCSGRRRRR